MKLYKQQLARSLATKEDSDDWRSRFR